MPRAPRLSIRQIVTLSVVVLALAGGLFGMVAVEPLARELFGGFGFDGPAPDREDDVLVILAATGFWTSILLAAALGYGLWDRERVTRRTVLACGVLGWLNCPIVLGTASITGGEPTAASGAVFGGLCVGIFVAFPLGLLYGVIGMLATRRLRPLLDRPTLTAHVAAERTVGLTVAAASGFGVLATTMFPLHFTAWVTPVLGVVGLAVTFHAWHRAAALRAFARAPDDPSFARVPLADLHLEPGA
ncbi:MAG: hypothetical protein R3B82_29360, partial [Sandaracinaceae bacterium]